MDPQTLVFVLVFAGIVLIFAEVFLPSGGIIGVMCLCCFIAATYCAYQAWYHTTPSYWWGYLGSVAVIIPTCVIGGFQILVRTPLGNRILLRAPTTEEVTPYQKELQHLNSLIGKQGIALTPMTPGGLVSVNGERIHAVSDGMSVEQNVPIEIVAVRGTRVVIRQVDPEPSGDFSELAGQDRGDESGDPWELDNPKS